MQESTRRGLREAIRIGGLGLFIAAALLAARQSGVFEGLEQTVWDGYLRASRPERADPRILVLEITERDIQSLGRWPLPDGVIASVLRELAGAGATAIGLDIYRDLPVPPGSEALAATLRELPNVVAVRHEGAGGRRSIAGPEALRDSEKIGFNDIVLDSDDTVRRGLLFLDDGEQVFSSFALRLALLQLEKRGVSAESDPERPSVIRLGPSAIPPLEPHAGGYVDLDAAGYQFLLDFAGAARAFESVTLGEFLDGQLDPARFRDRIVLIGLSAESTNDFFQLPFLDPVHSGTANAGVALHGHIASQLVRLGLGESRAIGFLAEWQEVAMIVALAALGAAAGAWLRSGVAFAVAVVAGVLALWLCGWLAFMGELWAPIVPSSLAWIGSAGLVTAYRSGRERAARAALMQLFARRVSPELAAEIWRRRDALLAEGRMRPQRLVATVLFVDMKGYTARAEKMEPGALMDWVNEFMAEMGSVIARHGGLVDDYFGDGIKAAFGVPFPRESEQEILGDARNAVQAALEMERSLLMLNGRWQTRSLPTVGMRVGIATGSVVAGEMGSEGNRLKYTVVGDVAVTAQRLESLDDSEHDFSRRPVRILVEERTAALLGERFATRRLGSFHLKGREVPVEVHAVLPGAGGGES